MLKALYDYFLTSDKQIGKKFEFPVIEKKEKSLELKEQRLATKKKKQLKKQQHLFAIKNAHNVRTKRMKATI